jgi:hypothetical protein
MTLDPAALGIGCTTTPRRSPSTSRWVVSHRESNPSSFRGVCVPRLIMLGATARWLETASDGTTVTGSCQGEDRAIVRKGDVQTG